MSTRINDLYLKKHQQQKISMVTCYDYWSAKIINQTDIDCILVGDSVAMVMHGETSTIPATVDMMALHTRAVAKANTTKFIVADMPFLSHRKDLTAIMDAVTQLMQSGAHAIKLEGGSESICDLIRYIVDAGVPVVGHIGLTPQSIHQLGGYRVQGKNQNANEIILQAQRLQNAGCFACVLECIPQQLAKQITTQTTMVTIGIGAGADTDGQVLVLHDLLGLQQDFSPKFLKPYLNGFTMIQEALNSYANEVKNGEFPTSIHSYNA